MLRRYRTIACPTMACVGTLLMCASPAVAATTGELPTPEPLWKAFPLNPPDERVVKAKEHPLIPPTTVALDRFVPASERSPRPGPGLILRATVFGLLCMAFIAFLRLFLWRSWSPAANDGSSDRLQAASFLGAAIAAEAVYGYAIYTIVVLLL
jgi:hypothetical protein